MREKTIRALGATAILAVIAIAAMAQVVAEDPADELTEPTLAAPATTMVDESSPATAAPTFDYRVGLLSAPSTDNYWRYLAKEPTAWNTYVLGPTKPSLFSIDPASSELHNELVEFVTEPVEQDGQWFVDVQLRTDKLWSDGTPITAHDLAFTSAVVGKMNLGGGWQSAYVPETAEIVANSEYEARILFDKRPSLEVWPFGIGLAPIMPEHIWGDVVDEVNGPHELYKSSADDDVYGGPMALTSSGDAWSAEMTRDDYIINVSYSVFDDEDAAVDALAEGSIDTILLPKGLSPASVDLLADVEGVDTATSPANSVRYLGFNLDRAPMSDKSFRNAVALLLDRGAVAEALSLGDGAGYTLLPPGNDAWFDEDHAAILAAPYDRTLEKRLENAIAGLVADGYTWDEEPTIVDGEIVAGSGLEIAGTVPAPLTILTPGDEYDPTRPDYAAEIESVIEILGFDVRPVITDFNAVVDLTFTTDDDGVRQYDMYLLGWTLGNPALPGFHAEFFTADGALNSTGYSRKVFEAAVEDFEASTSVEEAIGHLWVLEEWLAKDKPYLVLYHPNIVEAYRSDRVGFEATGVLGGIQGRSGGVGDLIPAG